MDDLLIQSNELHLPIGLPVKALLRSKDVLHNFAVPQFRVKMDLVPGVVTYVWFTPTRTGRFDILCEELCGMAHFTMRGHIVVDAADDYQHWLNQQITFKESMSLAKGNIVKGKQLYATCVACHGEQGEGNVALNAPRIAGLSNWYLNRQLNYFKNKVRGTNADDNLGQQMAAMSMTLTDEFAVKDVSAYINSLTPNIANQSISGNLAKGKSLYQNCAFCHGDNGQGNYAMNAPKLSGQADWYIKRQLSNYKHGVRGKHPKDLYGNQMVLMSKTLYDESAINDVVSYINTLEKSD
jgi:cytochrome c oxidase subunit 2